MDIEMNNYLNEQHFYPTWGKWFFLFENDLIYEIPEMLKLYFSMTFDYFPTTSLDEINKNWSDKEFVIDIFYDFLRDKELTVLDGIYCIGGEDTKIKYIPNLKYFLLYEDNLPF